MFLPREAPWLVAFENELFAFPNGRYDDQVDALIQALAYKLRAPLWNDAALKGFGNFMNSLVLQKNERLLAGFRNAFEIAVNFPSIACFAFEKFPVPGRTGNYGVSASTGLQISTNRSHFLLKRASNSLLLSGGAHLCVRVATVGRTICKVTIPALGREVANRRRS